MKKTATLNLRIDPEVKHQAEAVLSKLGISMSSAIDMYLRKISSEGGIPFTLSVASDGNKNPAAVSTGASDTVKRRKTVKVTSASADARASAGKEAAVKTEKEEDSLSPDNEETKIKKHDKKKHKKQKK